MDDAEGPYNEITKMSDQNQKKRSLRLADLIKEEIARMLLKGIKDPRVDMVNLTFVKLTPDLRHAKIYFRVSKISFDVDDVQKGLNSAKNYIRRELLKSLGIKFIPELRFIYDVSIENSEKLRGILEKIKGEESETKSAKD